MVTKGQDPRNTTFLDGPRERCSLGGRLSEGWSPLSQKEGTLQPLMDQSQWTCSSCTYASNHNLMNRCEICSSPRGSAPSTRIDQSLTLTGPSRGTRPSLSSYVGAESTLQRLYAHESSQVLALDKSGTLGSISAGAGGRGGIVGGIGVSGAGAAPLPLHIHATSAQVPLPFALWFSAFRAWPHLRVYATPGVGQSYFVGFGRVIDTRPSSSFEVRGGGGGGGGGRASGGCDVRIRLLGLEPAGALRSPQASLEVLRSALLGLAEDGGGGWAVSLEDFVSTCDLLQPKTVSCLPEPWTSGNFTMISGGGSLHIKDSVAVLMKCKVDLPHPPPSPASPQKKQPGKMTRCRVSLEKCKQGDKCMFSHSAKEQEQARREFMGETSPLKEGALPADTSRKENKPRWFIDGVVRLECGSEESQKSASQAWLSGAENEGCMDGSLAGLAAAQSSPHFVRTLAKRLKLLPAAGSGVGQQQLLHDDAVVGAQRWVLSALFALPRAWAQLRSALSGVRGEGGDDAEAALALLKAAARVLDERVLAAASHHFEALVVAAGAARTVTTTLTLAASAPTPSAAASSLGEIVGALISRLPSARARARDVPATLYAAFRAPSYATHWLDVPLVPTLPDLGGGARDWLSSTHLKGLETRYKSPQEYLERLFRLLRADALADMGLRVGQLSRGEAVPDRELRCFRGLSVLGYRARGGEVQVALAFQPVTPPRGGSVEGARLLMDGSLVCIAPRGVWRELGAYQWAVVVGVGKVKALDAGVVVVEVLAGAGWSGIDALRALLAAPPGGGEMVENPEFFTASRFALQRLQALGKGEAALPFAHELVKAELRPARGLLGGSGTAAAAAWQAHLDAPATAQGIAKAVEGLDDAQQHTVHKALRTRVWVSQGPPGTGKTTASVAFFSALRTLPLVTPALAPVQGVGGGSGRGLYPAIATPTPTPTSLSSSRPRRPVLMLAVKNHALDQFLGRIQARHPDAKLVRVGGVAASAALAATNLMSVREALEAKCRAKAAEVAPLVPFWRVKCAAGGALRDAQAALGRALDASLLGCLTAESFLGSLLPTQLRDLVLGAKERIQALCSVHVDGVDLPALYAQQLADLAQSAGGGGVGLGDEGGGGRGGGYSGVVVDGPSFFAILEGAPSLVDCGKVDEKALEEGEVTVGKKKKRGGTATLPKLKAVALAALSAWVEEVGGDVSVRSMFETSPAERAKEREKLLQMPPPSAAAGGGGGGGGTAGGGARDEADTINATMDDILRAQHADERLDDRDDDGSGDESAQDSRTFRRRTAEMRSGVAGVLDAIHMTPLSSLGASSGKGSEDPLAALSFTTNPLKPAFASLLLGSGEEGEEEEEGVGEGCFDLGPLCSLSPRARALFLHTTSKSLSSALEAAYTKALLAFRTAASADTLARAGFEAAAIADFDVIGMTINGAAKHAALLAAVRPEVVIVEEAAEVKEPLLVAALPSSARLLFMAGDHMQLPPKPAHYPFSQPKFGLAVSLFKRLVDAGLDHGKLKQQSRMHPDLAAVVRAVGVYGEDGYQDKGGDYLPSLNRAQGQRGAFWKTAAFWWTHSDPEDNMGSGQARSNKPEALRVARAAAWHMSNGVHPSRIVVLTGYAAQVALVTTMLRQTDILPKVTIDEARRQGMPEGATTKSDVEGGGVGGAAPAATEAIPLTSTAVQQGAALAVRHRFDDAIFPRVCTIDEFQGDEADHIILSLVRSGGEKLGFLKDKERLVVAVSRARRSLLIVGNKDTFSKHSPKFWGVVAEHLRERDAIGPALPLMCPRHPGHGPTLLVRTAAELPISPSLRPCKRPCGLELPCGHPCPSLVCHSDLDHAAIKCKVVKELPPNRAACGHSPRAECWEFAKFAPNLPPCKAYCKKEMRCKHKCPFTCHHGKDETHAAAMHECKVLVPHTYQDCKHIMLLECFHINQESSSTPVCSSSCNEELSCGHPCQMECGEPCAASKDNGRCSFCIAENDEKRIAEVKVRADVAAQIIAQAKEKAVAAAEREKGKALKQLALESSEYEDVMLRVLRSVHPGHALDLHVQEIYRVEKMDLEARLWEAVKEMQYPSTLNTPLFHGTAVKNVPGILKDGFIVERSRNSAGQQSHAVNMLGAAVYLCPDSSKAARPEYLGGQSGALLLCDVFLGGKKEVLVPDITLDSKERRKTESYDSVMMRRKTATRQSAVLFDEYAIYDTRLVLPRYVINVTSTTGAPAATLKMKPIDMVGNVIFYDITADFVKSHGDSPEATHFYKAQGLFTQLGNEFAGKKLTKVTYCFNPALKDRFEKAKLKLLERGFPADIFYRFHGTSEANLRPIQLEGLRMPQVDIASAVGMAYGNGIYLGVTPELSAGYAKNCSKMLLVEALNGKNKGSKLTINEVSADASPVNLKPFQSFDVGNYMFIVASSHMIHPLYVVHWVNIK